MFSSVHDLLIISFPAFWDTQALGTRRPCIQYCIYVHGGRAREVQNSVRGCRVRDSKVTYTAAVDTEFDFGCTAVYYLYSRIYKSVIINV